MTEKEWLTSKDPVAMLQLVSIDRPATIPGWRMASDRKLRLFCIDHMRTINYTHRTSSEVLEIAEQFADGLITKAKASKLSRLLWGKGALVGDHWPIEQEPIVAANALVRAQDEDDATRLREIFGNPWKPYYFANRTKPAGTTPANGDAKFVLLPSSIRDWNDGTVVRLAQAAYDERGPSGMLAWDTMAILADALEEAGCHDKDILAHCRAPLHHCRGCWLIDLILGKE